jgi:hypothetical protein
MNNNNNNNNNSLKHYPDSLEELRAELSSLPFPDNQQGLLSWLFDSWNLHKKLSKILPSGEEKDRLEMEAHKFKEQYKAEKKYLEKFANGNLNNNNRTNNETSPNNGTRKRKMSNNKNNNNNNGIPRTAKKVRR